jgi:hypothetical protein
MKWPPRYTHAGVNVPDDNARRVLSAAFPTIPSPTKIESEEYEASADYAERCRQQNHVIPSSAGKQSVAHFSPGIVELHSILLALIYFAPLYENDKFDHHESGISAKLPTVYYIVDGNTGHSADVP